MSIPIQAKLPIKEKRDFKTYQQVFHSQDRRGQKKSLSEREGFFNELE
jgi:hypothetical protein